MTKAYREGTTLDQILRDGWSRDFEVEQTLQEATDMGYNVSLEHIEQMWQLYQDDEDAFFKSSGTTTYVSEGIPSGYTAEEFESLEWKTL